MVPATVVAQVSRDRRRQVQLGRFLATCTVVPLSEEDAHEAGRLAGRAGTSDVVDASLVVLALRTRAIIVTGDKQDIERLVVAGGGEVPIVDA